jgi:ribosomal protein L5
MATPKLLERYRNEVVPTMTKEFDYPNVMRVPRIEKVVLNMGRHDHHCRTEARDHKGQALDRSFQAA